MTASEREFMNKIKGPRGKSLTKSEAKKYREAQSAHGKAGMLKRWGEHGPTKSVRAFAATVDRFRDAIPAERDRAQAATDALDAWLDKRGTAAPVKAGPPITINAVLTYHWYGEIEAGRKTVEYREINDYWESRLWADGLTERIAAIRFSRGYTNTRMTWEVTEIVRNDEDGVFEIHLGKRIS